MILCVYRQESQKNDAPQPINEKYLPSIHEASARRETASLYRLQDCAVRQCNGAFKWISGWRSLKKSLDTE